MIALLRDKRGAASVLVVFMMIVLVVFATLAFTTAYANYHLAKKAARVTEENYAIDALASRIVMQIDSALAQAETDAQNAMLNGAIQGHIDGATAGQSGTVRRAYDNSRVRGEFLHDLMKRMFMHFAIIRLDELCETLPGIYFNLTSPYDDGDFFDFSRPAPAGGEILVFAGLTAGSEQGDKQLDIELVVQPVLYIMDSNGAGEVSGERAPDYHGRYYVQTWKQWQIPFVYEDGMEFGDARISLDDMR